MQRCFAITLIMLISLPAAAASAPGTYYVQGSWINVRTGADSGSPILDHLTTNTAVTLIASHPDSCEIRWQNRHGYIPCHYLGTSPVTSEQLSQIDGQGHRVIPDAPLRAFWLAPSHDTLFAAGKYLEKTRLSPQQREIEAGLPDEQRESPNPPAPRIIRYPIPEFDAMKALMAQGVTLTLDNQAIASLWPQCLPPGHAESADPGWYDCDRARLPPVQPSLFRNLREFSDPAPDVDRLSALFGIPETGNVQGGPSWTIPYMANNHSFVSAWDIGSFRTTLTRPIVEEVVAQDGTISAYEWTPVNDMTPDVDMSYCHQNDIGNGRQAQYPLPGQPPIKHALLWFEVPAALPYRHATIKRSIWSLPASQITQSNHNEITRTITYVIDLNQDGIPDLVQLDLWDKIQDAQHYVTPPQRNIFVNVNGQWRILQLGFDGANCD
jgi:uncharacterized protein YgiM (DUF1202 family)